MSWYTDILKTVTSNHYWVIYPFENLMKIMDFFPQEKCLYFLYIHQEFEYQLRETTESRNPCFEERALNFRLSFIVGFVISAGFLRKFLISKEDILKFKSYDLSSLDTYSTKRKIHCNSWVWSFLRKMVTYRWLWQSIYAFSNDF